MDDSQGKGPFVEQRHRAHLEFHISQSSNRRPVEDFFRLEDVVMVASR
jgi:hypothetical protein